MTRDRSLDEFLASEEGDDDPGARGDGAEDEEPDAAGTVEAGRDAGDASGDAGSLDDADVAPMEPTTAWSPAGAPCGDCGAVAERRWRDDGDLVCEDCKNW